MDIAFWDASLFGRSLSDPILEPMSNHRKMASGVEWSSSRNEYHMPKNWKHTVHGTNGIEIKSTEQK